MIPDGDIKERWILLALTKAVQGTFIAVSKILRTDNALYSKI